MPVILGLIALGYLLYRVGFYGTIFVTVFTLVFGFIALAIKDSLMKSNVNQINQKVGFEAKNQMETCSRLITKHVQELSIKEQQMVLNESYGLKNYSRWIVEKKRFITNVIRPEIKDELTITEESISNVIDSAVNQFRVKYPQLANTGFTEEISPVEYEHHCATILRQAGWDANITVASGDQGADVIAKKSGKTVVLQCKKYSRPVGNKAVQEAHTAKYFYNANHAIVVSNASYTNSAKVVANKLGVLLIHHNELSALDQKFPF